MQSQSAKPHELVRLLKSRRADLPFKQGAWHGNSEIFFFCTVVSGAEERGGRRGHGTGRPSSHTLKGLVNRIGGGGSCSARQRVGILKVLMRKNINCRQVASIAYKSELLKFT